MLFEKATCASIAVLPDCLGDEHIRIPFCPKLVVTENTYLLAHVLSMLHYGPFGLLVLAELLSWLCHIISPQV